MSESQNPAISVMYAIGGTEDFDSLQDLEEYIGSDVEETGHRNHACYTYSVPAEFLRDHPDLVRQIGQGMAMEEGYRWEDTYGLLLVGVPELSTEHLTFEVSVPASVAALTSRIRIFEGPDSKKNALEYAQRQFGADHHGRIGLVSSWPSGEVGEAK